MCRLLRPGGPDLLPRPRARQLEDELADSAGGGIARAPAPPGCPFTRTGPRTTDRFCLAPWFHPWFHVELIWADLRAPQPTCRAAAGSRCGGSGDLITRRSRFRIPPPLLERPAFAGLSAVGVTAARAS